MIDGLTGTYTNFIYDNYGRLHKGQTFNSGGTYTGGSTYNWDKGTNRIDAWDSGGSTRTFTYNGADQLTNQGSTTFTYDANGSLTATNAGFSASYDTRNRATSINGVSQTYADTGQSERVTSGTKTFRTRLLGGLADETSGGVTTSWVRDPSGNPISQTKSGSTHYFLFDELGSVRSIQKSHT